MMPTLLGENDSKSGTPAHAATGQSSDTTDAVDSSSDGSLDHGPKRKRVHAPRKRGKPTYYIRKNEISELQDQVEKLRDELSELKTGATKRQASLSDAHALTGHYTDSMERNNLTIARTQSILASSTLSMMNATSAIPLATYIHLPLDAHERDTVLRVMRASKLEAAHRYITERVRYLDVRIAYRQGECFDYPDGSAANSAFEIIPFACEHSLRDVYEEFQFWLRNQEITISESMGVLTIRESDDLEEFTYGQSRLLTSVLDGVEIESNLALFTTCEDAYALSAIDSVDQDDLYPYRSAKIARKEMTAAILLVEVPTPNGGRAVSMCRWSFIRFRGPTGGVNTGQMAAMRDTMVGLCDVMPRMMAERLALRARLSSTPPIETLTFLARQLYPY